MPFGGQPISYNVQPNLFVPPAAPQNQGMAAPQNRGMAAPQSQGIAYVPPRLEPPRAKVRGAMPREAKAVAPRDTARIPTPEELGVSGSRPSSAVAVNWAATRARLQQAGAVSYQAEKLSEGQYRFRCWLSASRGGKTITAEGSTEAEAVAKALAQLSPGAAVASR